MAPPLIGEALLLLLLLAAAAFPLLFVRSDIILAVVVVRTLSEMTLNKIVLLGFRLSAGGDR